MEMVYLDVRRQHPEELYVPLGIAISPSSTSQHQHTDGHTLILPEKYSIRYVLSDEAGLEVSGACFGVG